jgi:transcription-repair coupling factor (superfamily II helicase)
MSDMKLNMPVDRLLGAKHGIASGVPEGFDALLIALLSQGAREGSARAPILHIARDGQRLTALEDALHFFAPDVKRLSFPAWDSVPYDRVAPNAEIVAERIATLAALANRKGDDTTPLIVLTTVNAMLQRVPPRDFLTVSSLRLAPATM